MQAEALTMADGAISSRWLRFRLLFRLLFSDYRDAAPFLLFSGIVIPAGVMLTSGSMLSGYGSGAAWVLAGNAVMALAIGSASFTLSRVGQLRLLHQLDFYATLPVGRGLFLLALFVLSQFTALPGLAGSLLLGHFALGIGLGQIMPALLPALLAAATLSIVGAAVGSLCRTMAQVNMAANLVTCVVLFLTPVMVPVERVFLPLRLLAHVLPTGQAALAIADALAGQFGLRFWLLTGALLLWVALAAIYGARRLDWRND